MKKVYEAVKQLIAWQQRATYSQIASAAGVKQMIALQVLNANKSLLTMDKNVVTGFRGTIIYKNPNEKWFSIVPVNYGYENTIEVHNGGNECDGMNQSYCEGGFGDSRMITIILASDDNLAKVKSLGYLSAAERERIPLVDRWIEENS